MLAGEASAKFSVLLGNVACFDCRISELPNESLVLGREMKMHIEMHLMLIVTGCFVKKVENPKKATKYLEGMSVGDKNELLFTGGTNFNDVPKWQKRGIGLYWEEYEKVGLNPINNKETKTKRKRIKIDYVLLMADKYSEFIRGIIKENK